MHAVYICTQCMPVVHTSATNPDGSLLRGNMNTMWLATHITATKLHYIARLTWPTCSHQTIYWCIPPCRPWCGVQQHIKCMGPKHPLHTHTQTLQYLFQDEGWGRGKACDASLRLSATGFRCNTEIKGYQILQRTIFYNYLYKET